MRLKSQILFAVLLGVFSLAVLPNSARAASGNFGPIIFSQTLPGSGTFTVPAGVNYVHITTAGGGSYYGKQLIDQADVAVTPGQVLNYSVGAKEVPTTYLCNSTAEDFSPLASLFNIFGADKAHAQQLAVYCRLGIDTWNAGSPGGPTTVILNGSTVANSNGSADNVTKTIGPAATIWLSGRDGYLIIESVPNVQKTFYVPGAYTWTVPAGVTSFTVQMWGGGGGGGNSAQGSGTPDSGGGGGSGYTMKTFNGVTPGTIYSLKVGAGGAGAPYLSGSFIAGGTGGCSYFGLSGNTCTSYTFEATGGGGGDPNSALRYGVGGMGYGGDVNYKGWNGTYGLISGDTVRNYGGINAATVGSGACTSPQYINQSACASGYQGNRPGAALWSYTTHGLDNFNWGRSQYDSAHNDWDTSGGDGYPPGNGGGNGAGSTAGGKGGDGMVVITFAPPSTPPVTNLTTTAGASCSHTVSLSWSLVSGATSYNVYRSNGPVFSVPQPGSGTSVSYTDTTVVPGTTYAYQVSAVTPSGEGLQSNPVSVQAPVCPPSFPTNVTAVPGSCGSNSITVSGNMPIPNLAGYWTFDNSSVSGSSAFDSSGNGNTATLVGSPSFVTGQSYQAVSLSGAAQYADVPNSPSLTVPTGGSVTMCGWFYEPTQITGRYVGLMAKRAWSYEYGMNFLNGTFQVYTSGPSGIQQFNYQIPAAAWTHICGVISSAPTALYVNGALFGTSPVGTGGGAYSDVQDLYIGASTAGAELFSGYIDGVQVFNRALSAMEIANIYNMESNGFASVPVGYNIVRNDGVAVATVLGPRSFTTADTSATAGVSYTYNAAAAYQSPAGNPNPYTYSNPATSNPATGPTLCLLPPSAFANQPPPPWDPTTVLQINWQQPDTSVSKAPTGYKLWACQNADCNSATGWISFLSYSTQSQSLKTYSGGSVSYTNGIIPNTSPSMALEYTGLTQATPYHFAMTSVIGNPATQESATTTFGNSTQRSSCDPNFQMSASVTANPPSVVCGNTSNITWTSYNADTCTLNVGGATVNGINNTVAGYPLGYTTFPLYQRPSYATLTCQRASCNDLTAITPIQVTGQCNTGPISLACSFMPPNTQTSPAVGMPIVLNIHVSSGTPPYMLNWTDSEGLNYSQTICSSPNDPACGQNPVEGHTADAQLSRIYGTLGVKNVTVTVTDNTPGGAWGGPLTVTCNLSAPYGPNVKIRPGFKEY